MPGKGRFGTPSLIAPSLARIYNRVENKRFPLADLLGTASQGCSCKLAAITHDSYGAPMRTVRVPLGKRTYTILIGKGLLRQLGPQCKELELGQNCAVISDRQV